MKNYLLLILFAGLFNIRAAAQQTDVQKDGLKGAVKNVRNFKIVKANNGKEERQLSNMHLYNDKGFMKGRVLYVPGSEVEEVASDNSYYYKEGRLMKIEYNSNFKLITTEEYKYNSQGRVEEIYTKQVSPDRFGLNGSDKKETFVYDEKGNCTEDKSFFPGYKTTYIVRKSYDAANRKTRAEQEKDGKVYRITEYVYDKKNQLIKETSKAADDKTIYEIIIYGYDDDGRMTSQETKDKDGKPYKTQTMKYKQGIETEELVTEKGKINKYTNEYTFDKTGNWITQKSYKNGEIYFNTERDIAYYTK